MKNTASDGDELYSSRIIQIYLNLLRARYAHVDIEHLLTCADMRPHQVDDPWHWFTQAQINHFYDHLIEATGNRHIAREAGRYAASVDATGIVQQFVLGFLGPARLFQHIGKTARHFTRSTRFDTRRLGRQRIEITVTPFEGVREREFQCFNRIGFFEAVVMLFCDQLPHIEHPECVFRGDACCRYVIAWPRPRFGVLKKIRNLVALAGLAGFPALFLLPSEPALQALLSLGLPGFLCLWMGVDQAEKRILKRNLEDLRNSSNMTIEQMEGNYNHALLINSIAQNVTRETSSDAIVASLVGNLQKHLAFDAGAVFLIDEGQNSLSYAGGYGFAPTSERNLKDALFYLDAPHTDNMLLYALRENRPVLRNNADSQQSVPPFIPEALDGDRFGSFACCPIVYNQEPIGVMAVGSRRTGKIITNRDTRTLYDIAPVAGISLHNARLLQNRRQQFNATLEVLAATIDAHDPLAAGHSERVTRFSVGICRQLGLDEELCEKVRVAALLHDYGKIAIPDAILKKPGRLSASEYERVKQHAHHTRKALENIPFEGIYKDVPAIAGAHHEKIDGSGYPQGLTGPHIPFEAKIIAVADFFEAITSRRHYRNPMPRYFAIRELKKRRGTAFEATVVDAFLQYLEEKNESPADGAPKTTCRIPRESLRVRCRSPLTITCGDTPTQATVMDISHRGLFAATPLSAREGSRVGLCFALPDRDGAPIETEGLVVWTNHSCLPRKPLFPAGLGIAFSALDGEQAARLARFIEACHEEPETQTASAAQWIC